MSRLIAHSNMELKSITFVRLCAFQAAAAAAGLTAMPGPVGIIVDLTGLDPVRPIQHRMLRILSKHYDFDLVIETRQLSRTNKRNVAVASVKKLAPQVLSTAMRFGATRLLGQQAKRLVPVVGPMVAATIAFRETWLLGLACLKNNKTKTKLSNR